MTEGLQEIGRGFIPIAAAVPPALEAAAREWIAARAEERQRFYAYLGAPEAFRGRYRLAWAEADEAAKDAAVAAEHALHAEGVAARTWYPVDGRLVGLVRTRSGLAPRIRPGWCPYPRRSRGGHTP